MPAAIFLASSNAYCIIKQSKSQTLGPLAGLLQIRHEVTLRAARHGDQVVTLDVHAGQLREAAPPAFDESRLHGGDAHQRMKTAARLQDVHGVQVHGLRDQRASSAT